MAQYRTATRTCQVTRVNGVTATGVKDALAVESPLAIILNDWSRGHQRSDHIAVTMRTPGEDSDLAIGLLVTEGLIRSPQDIMSVEHTSATTDRTGQPDTVNVYLRRGVTRLREPALRRGHIHSSCGVCAIVTPDEIHMPEPKEPGQLTEQVSTDQIQNLLGQLRDSQQIFKATGGLHASALGTFDGRLIATHEDIGRHNALDKLIGKQFLASQLPLSNRVLIVSGRTSYELVHKANIAGLRVIVGVGAASSLAVEYAKAANMALVGFAREDRLTIYCGQEYMTEVQR